MLTYLMYTLFLIIVANLFSIPDGIIFIIFLICLFFLKGKRKIVLSSYLIFNLTMLSYALYELFWLLLAFLLLLNHPYIVERNEEKWISRAYRVRKSWIFIGILLLSLLVSVKNHIYYGTNFLAGGITRPIKLSMEKIKMEWEIKEPVWVVPYRYSDHFRWTFRTKDHFPLESLKEFYKDRLSTQAVKYEKKMFDKLFPYEKYYVIRLINRYSQEKVDYKFNYKDLIASKNRPEKSLEDYNVIVYIFIKPGNVLDKGARIEESIYNLINYYRDKGTLPSRILLYTYPEDSNFISFEKKYSGKRYRYILYPGKSLIIEPSKKSDELFKEYNNKFTIKKEELQKITSIKDLRKHWEK